MKNIFTYGALAAALLFPLASFAAEFRVGEQPSVAAQERITDDVYIAGGSVTSAGVIVGDLLAAGGSVVVSGDVGADANISGGNITILSNVADDLRVGGGTVVVQGKVGGDVIIGGGQVTVGGSGVGGDVVIGGGTVRIDAPVAGKMRIGGGTVFINAPITGDVIIDADRVTLGSAAVISGNLTYTATRELTKEQGAVVRGQTKFTERVKPNVSAKALVALFSVWVLGKFLVLLVCALAVGLLFKRFSKEAVAKAAQYTFPAFGVGALTLVALPALSVFLLATVIGIPFGIIGLLGFAAALIFTCIISPIILGSAIHHFFSKREWEISWKTILLGTLVYSVLGLIPVLGWLLQALIGLLSLGVIAMIKWEIVKQWR